MAEPAIICQPPICPNGDCIGCREGNLWCNDPRCYPRCSSCSGLPHAGLTTGMIIALIIVSLIIIIIIIYVLTVVRRPAIATPITTTPIVNSTYESTSGIATSGIVTPNYSTISPYPHRSRPILIPRDSRPTW